MTERRWLRGLIRGTFDGAVVLTAYLGALFCFFDLLPLDVDTTAPKIVGIMAILLGLPLFWQTKHRRALPLGALGLYALVMLYFWREMVRGAVAVGCALSEIYAANIPGVVQLYPLEKMSAWQYVEAAGVFMQLIAVPAAFFLCWAVAWRHSFWAVFLGTAPTVLASVIVMRTPPMAPLLALLGCWIVMLAAGTAKHDRFAAAKIGLLAIPATALLMLAAYRLVPAQDYQRSPRVEQVRMLVNGVLSGDLLGITGSSPFSQADGRSQLAEAGSLHFTGETALRVYSEQPEKIYLRGFGAELYDGAAWAQADTAEYERAMQGVDFSPFNLMADVMRSSDPAQLPYSVYVEPVRTNGAYLYAPYAMLTRPGELPGATFQRDSYIHWQERGPYEVQTMGLSAVAEPLSTPDSLRQAERYYQGFIQQTCLDVPADTAGLLRQIAAEQGIPSGEGADWKEIVDGVAAYIRSAARYDASPGRPDQGEDYVTYFLLENKRGYCMHFASAGVLMLRSLGVPARYVEGYVVNADDFDEQGWAAVPDSQAHAWAEVYLQGVGWLPVEMTPGFGGTTLEESTPVAGAVQQEMEEQPEQLPQQQPEEQQPEQQPEPEDLAGETGQSRPWQGMLLLLAVGAGLVLLRPLAAAALRHRRFTKGEPNGRVLAMYRYAQRLERWQEAAPCVETLALKAKFSPHRLTEEEARQVYDALLAQQDRLRRSQPVWRRLWCWVRL